MRPDVKLLRFIADIRNIEYNFKPSPLDSWRKRLIYLSNTGVHCISIKCQNYDEKIIPKEIVQGLRDDGFFVYHENGYLYLGVCRHDEPGAVINS